jgi:renalase
MPAEILIVGAGLAGIMAGRSLVRAGKKVALLEASDQAGGRMATIRLQRPDGREAVWDMGAQFFTVREPRFEQIVKDWLKERLIVEWSRGFATADGSYYADGHPRYRGVPDMAALPKRLAKQLDVNLQDEVVSISPIPSGWQLTTRIGQKYFAEKVMLTLPVGQSTALLQAGGVALPPQVQKALNPISYEPCIALLLLLEGPGRFPEPGGMWPIGEPIIWMADNYRKGVSPTPGATTLHAGPEFSAQHWQTADDEVVEMLISAAAEWLGDAVEHYQIHRWRYSKPVWTHPEPYLALQDPAPLVFAGDAFAGPRVEGAALSGLAAADWLLEIDS